MTVTRRFAREAGIDLSVSKPLQVATANGVIDAVLATAEEVSVGNAVGRDILLAVHSAESDGMVSGIDGLLGLSFLANFDMVLTADRLELIAR